MSLDEQLEAIGAVELPVTPMSAALLAELGSLAPVATRRPRRQLAILVAGSLVYAAIVLMVVTVRRDAHELAPWLLGAGALWFAGFVLAARLAVVPRAGDVMPPWSRAVLVGVIAAIGFVALGFLVHPHGDASVIFGWPRFLDGHGCLELGLLVAVVPTVLGALALRGVFAVRARWVAAALGAGGGCLGGLVLHLHCPIADGPHIALMHGGVVAASALLAALVLPRVLEPRV